MPDVQQRPRKKLAASRADRAASQEDAGTKSHAILLLATLQHQQYRHCRFLVQVLLHDSAFC